MISIVTSKGWPIRWRWKDQMVRRVESDGSDGQISRVRWSRVVKVRYKSEEPEKPNKSEKLKTPIRFQEQRLTAIFKLTLYEYLC